VEEVTTGLPISFAIWWSSGARRLGTGLVDIDKKALKDMEAYCKALLNRAKSDFTLHTTTNRDEALPKADFVVITISTGGLEAMRPTWKFPTSTESFSPWVIR
jgi:alpha-galactosidase/6-phospho-beta-glucosidase family protein